MPRATVLPIIKRRWHDKSKLHVRGKLILSSGDYASEVASGDLILVSAEYRSVSSITDDLNLVVANAFSNNANDPAPKRLDRLTTITGSIDVTASASVLGVGTLFTKEVSKGDLLVIGTATVGEAREVVDITDDTHLTVGSAFTDLANDAAPQICKVQGLYGTPDWTVLTGSIDPAASTAVVGVNTRFLGRGIPFSLAMSEVLSSKAPVELQAWGRSGFLYSFVPKEKLQTLTGSIDPAASTAVVGVGTLFLSELKKGDQILVSTERRYVTDITDDLNLTVNQAFSNNANDTAPKKVVSDATLRNGLLQIRGLVVVGGGAAAGTKALYLNSGVLTKEEAANAVGGIPQLLTEAVPAAVLSDDIDFHAIFDVNA